MSVVELAWMRPDAPYMPIATAGLLAVLERAEIPTRARWSETLVVDTEATVDDIAVAIAEAELPDLERIDWPATRQQALRSTLEKLDDPVETFRRLVVAASPPERRLLMGIATDQAVEDKIRTPRRTRLLRGAKSDLSAFKPLNRTAADTLARELRAGPRFGTGDSGLALGLVPEVQTFGGSVGRQATTIGAQSPLLSRLLRHGVLELPPIGVRHGGRHLVGGPLIDDNLLLSWPRWTISCGLRELRAVFAFGELQEGEPDLSRLRARGIDAVYRSRLQQLSTTGAVFRWGVRIA